jgi:hypothetical protein
MWFTTLTRQLQGSSSTSMRMIITKEDRWSYHVCLFVSVFSVSVRAETVTAGILHWQAAPQP